MKFTIKTSGENIHNLMREVGYQPAPLFQAGKEADMSFIRALERSGYPRFHIYLKIDVSEITFNLHLDQKKPVYKNSPAHSADYEGPAIETEAQRIIGLIA